MARRLIEPAETFEDEAFGALDDRQALIRLGLKTALITDDQGRFPDNAALIRSRLFPYRDVPVADVQEALDGFVDAGWLHRYEANGQSLLQDVGWWLYQKPQWAKPSRYPAPEGWTDRVRHRENGEYIESDGWTTPGGFGVQVNASGEDFTRTTRANPSALRDHPHPHPHPDPHQHPDPKGKVKPSSSDKSDRGHLEDSGAELSFDEVNLLCPRRSYGGQKFRYTELNWNKLNARQQSLATAIAHDLNHRRDAGEQRIPVDIRHLIAFVTWQLLSSGAAKALDRYRPMREEALNA